MISQLKNIFFDILLLYKNFFHWNISKILVIIFAFLLGILLALPFVILFMIFAFFDPVNRINLLVTSSNTHSAGLTLLPEFLSHGGYMIFGGFLLLLSFCAFVFGYNYKIIPLSHLYLSYIESQKISFFKNIYFNIQKISTFFFVFSWAGLILLLPVLFFLFSFGIIVTGIILFGQLDAVAKMIEIQGWTNIFSLSLGILFLLSSLIFMYLGYRITFSYLIFIDTKNYPEKQKSLFYIKESWKKTSGTKIFRFLLIIFIYLVFSFLMSFVIDFVTNIANSVGNFFVFLVNIFIFLLLGNILEMIIVSSYRHIILDKKEKENFELPFNKENKGEEKIL